MKTIKVIILEGKKTAKEVNSLIKPLKGGVCIGRSYQLLFKRWKFVEENLRIFEIENFIAPANEKMLKEKYQMDGYEVGRKYDAVIIGPTKVTII